MPVGARRRAQVEYRVLSAVSSGFFPLQCFQHFWYKTCRFDDDVELVQNALAVKQLKFLLILIDHQPLLPFVN